MDDAGGEGRAAVRHQSRLDESLRRILRWKFGSGIVCDPFVGVDKVNEIVGTPAHLARADRIADQVITLIKNDDDLLPLSDDISTVLVTGSGATALQALVDEFDARGVTPTKVVTGTPVVAIAISARYDIAHFTEVSTYLADYAGNAVTSRACARVLFGEVNPEGRLPVSIPTANVPKVTLYPYGWGLSYDPVLMSRHP